MDTREGNKRVSVVIPLVDGRGQPGHGEPGAADLQGYEVDVVRGVGPAARARNVGARRARGDILLFIDDDAYFGTDDALETLVGLLDADPHTAIAGHV
jgi:hypothetical protein